MRARTPRRANAFGRSRDDARRSARSRLAPAPTTRAAPHVMLEQDAEEALDRREQRAVQHRDDRARRRAPARVARGFLAARRRGDRRARSRRARAVVPVRPATATRMSARSVPAKPVTISSPFAANARFMPNSSAGPSGYVATSPPAKLGSADPSGSTRASASPSKIDTRTAITDRPCASTAIAFAAATNAGPSDHERAGRTGRDAEDEIVRARTEVEDHGAALRRAERRIEGAVGEQDAGSTRPTDGNVARPASSRMLW